MSRSQWQAKKASGSAGGKAKALAKSKQVPKQVPKQKASKRLACASNSLEQNASECSSKRLADSDLRSPISDSETIPQKEDLPGPPIGEQPASKSDHQSLIDHYHDVFLAVRGLKPVIGGREAKSVKSLLASVSGDLAKAKSILDNAFHDEWWSTKVTILEIAANPSKFICLNLPITKTPCPDSIQFTEKHRGLAKRGSIDINLAWTKFKANSKSLDRKAVDWSAAFEASLAEAADRIGRAAAYRANGPDAQRGARAAPVASDNHTPATPATPLPLKARPRADSEDAPKHRDVAALLKDIG
jgi:hypothetical protein